jgi:hypothetical protein
MKEQATLQILTPAEMPIPHPGYECQYQHTAQLCLLHAGVLLGLVLETENVGNMLALEDGLQCYTAVMSHPQM